MEASTRLRKNCPYSAPSLATKAFARGADPASVPASCAVILADIHLLGIFEDGPQQDFVATIIESLAPSCGHAVTIERRLTAGCRFDFLNEHLGLAAEFAGVVIGVDGAGLARDEKIRKLAGRCKVPPVTLWSIAEPAIEEWMMADAEALPTALAALFGTQRVHHAPRPARSNSERTAKTRLREWTEQLLGEPALQGGVEYAAHTARRVSPGGIGAAQNRDFRHLLDELPRFLAACAAGPDVS